MWKKAIDMEVIQKKLGKINQKKDKKNGKKGGKFIDCDRTCNTNDHGNMGENKFHNDQVCYHNEGIYITTFK